MTRIKFFPETSDVFFENVELCDKHFYPLVTIDLSTVDKELSGLIHIVYSNNDPYSDESEKYYTDYCNNDLMIFDLVDNKLKFKGEFGFFKTNDDWIEWLDKGRKSYTENKEKFEKGEFDLSEAIKNLGTKPDWLQEENWPTNDNGQKLKFICHVYSGDFVSDYCEEEIY
ncbi:MAG: hypothetical protein ACKO96_04150, partial [Flammeovirgaceae bacterium]